MSDAKTHVLEPEKWVTKYADYLYNYAITRVDNQEIAKDLVQETFFSGVKGKDGFKGQAAERTWLISILKRKIIDYYRKINSAKGQKEVRMNFYEDGEQKGSWIEERAPALRKGELDQTAGLIERSVRIKAQVVEEDPEERGVRAILNFGHTFGHALESLSGFSVLHGEAVAAGMRMEARLGESIGVTEVGVGERLDSVLEQCGLPEVLEPPIDVDELLERARVDKKSREGSLRWVLLAELGRVAPGPDGAVTHPIAAARCRGALEAALRRAFETADSDA